MAPASRGGSGDLPAWPRRAVTPASLRHLFPTLQTAACGFCLIVFAPIFFGDLCASGLINGCASCMATIGGLVAALGGAAALAAFGLMADSDLRRSFEDHWSSSSFRSGGKEYRLDTGDFVVMYAAAVAGACAVIGGVLAMGRGTACAGPAKTAV